MAVVAPEQQVDLLDPFTRAFQQHRPRADYGAIPQTTQGVQTLGSLAPVLGGAIAGDVGQILGAYVPLIGQLLGIPLNQPLQLTYGGNIAEWRRYSAITAPLQQKSSRQLGAAVINGLQSISKEAGFDLTRLAPQAETLGNIISGISIAVPELRQAIATFAPNVVLDYTPLVNAAYTISKGAPTPQLVETLAQQLSAVQSAGYAGNVPAQYLVDTFNKVTHVGSKDPILATVGAARAADRFVQHGFGTYEQGLQLAQSWNMPPETWANDPQSLTRIDQLAQLAKANAVSPALLAQVAQIAAQNGQQAFPAMLAAAASGAIKEQLGAGAGVGKLQSAAVTALSDTERSQSLGALARAYEQGGEDWQRAINKAANNPQALGQLAARAQQQFRARRSPLVSGTDTVASKLSPDAMLHLQRQDLANYARQTGDPQLRRLLSPEGSDELAKRLATRDMSNLSPKAMKFLSTSGPTAGRLGASALALHKKPAHAG